MSSNSLYLQLTGTSSIKRRIGLNKHSNTGRPMLRQGVQANIENKEVAMPANKVRILVPRGKGKASAMNEKSNSKLNAQKEDSKVKANHEEDEEAIFRMPDSFSSDSEEEVASIKPTVFKTSSDDSTTTKKASNQNSETRPSARTSLGSRSSARTKWSTVRSSQSPKRKSQEEIPSSSATDMFGRLISSKKAKFSYGSSSQRKDPSSSQHSLPKSSQGMQVSETCLDIEALTQKSQTS